MGFMGAGGGGGCMASSVGGAPGVVAPLCLGGVPVVSLGGLPAALSSAAGGAGGGRCASGPPTIRPLPRRPAAAAVPSGLQPRPGGWHPACSGARRVPPGGPGVVGVAGRAPPPPRAWRGGGCLFLLPRAAAALPALQAAPAERRATGSRPHSRPQRRRRAWRAERLPASGAGPGGSGAGFHVARAASGPRWRRRRRRARRPSRW